MAPAPPRELVLCSKSTWSPAIRREHALARLAAGHGTAVTFIERPLDIRAIRQPAGARAWLTGLRARPAGSAPLPGVRVLPTSVVVPSHRGRIAEEGATLLLRRRLEATRPGEATVVATVPWQWPAVVRVPAARRVFDCADDWSRQIPGRAEWIEALYARIAREADAVIVVNPEMVDRFPGARAVVVRNAVADDLLQPLTNSAQEPRMVWAGTLSERFDAALAGEVLRLAPEWTLELYGQCQYAGRGEAPSDELAALLEAFPDRARHHGVIDRERLAAAIDTGSVSVILNRADQTHGQDSMKLYDYAARGRPIVTTTFSNTTDADAPPHLRRADTAAAFARALADSLAEPTGNAAERRAWAERHSWEARWPAWSAALFGD